jgi:hypothetical protein
MMDSGELAYSGESALPCAFMGTDQVDAASFILLVPEAGRGFVIPSSFASLASTILVGRSLDSVQFLNRCGTTA